MLTINILKRLWRLEVQGLMRTNFIVKLNTCFCTPAEVLLRGVFSAVSFLPLECGEESLCYSVIQWFRCGREGLLYIMPQSLRKCFWYVLTAPITMEGQGLRFTSFLEYQIQYVRRNFEWTPPFELFIEKWGSFNRKTSVCQGFPILALWRGFHKTSKIENKNFCAGALFEHSFLTKRSQ